MKIGIVRILLFLVSVLAGIFDAKAGAPINFIGYKSPSIPIFSKAGPTVINYQLYAQYDGIHKPGGGLDEGGFVVIVIKNSNNGFLYSYPILPDSIPGGFGGHTTSVSQPYLFKPYVLATGSFQFSNPFDQKLIVEEQIFYSRPLEIEAGFPAQEWNSASGQSFVSGGDNPPVVLPPSIGTPTPAPVTRSSIHAVIISGLSDPAKVVTSANVTLTGGVVALGKNPSPPATPTTQWSTGMRIVPDQALLTGSEIPPLTPNIIDVRIVKHEVRGDLSTPAP
jgi:hypothetical protein